MNEVEYIKSRLEQTERLLGLTEEALELALAALKLRRVLDGRNPTPVTEEQAVENLLEEYGDVLNSIEVLITPTQNEQAMQTRAEKRSRWVSRLKAAAMDAERDCNFCRAFDFSSARCVVDRHGAYIAFSSGSSKYPRWQQFRFCPQCGAELHGGGTLTEPEEKEEESINGD